MVACGTGRRLLLLLGCDIMPPRRSLPRQVRRQAMSILVVAVALLSQASSAEDAQRQERLQYMKDRAAEFSLARESSKEALTLKEEPIVRFSNPERESGT